MQPTICFRFSPLIIRNIAGKFSPYTYRSIFSSSNLGKEVSSGEIDESGRDKESVPKKVQSSPNEIIKIPDEDTDEPRKHVFQVISKIQHSNPVYTIEEAKLPERGDNDRIIFRYPSLRRNFSYYDYFVRGIDNADTRIINYPDVTDFLIVGSGLIGSATAYYTKKLLSRTADVLVIDKDPYTTHNTTAICSGLISAQSKSRDVSRVATITKELIRDLKNDVLVTPEDYASIKYRPCSHLVLWPENEIDEVAQALDFMIDDDCFIESCLPSELPQVFPWLNVENSDIALGTFGAQDEAIVDPIALRNLYRTLAQAHGANFVVGEAIDFNTMHHVSWNSTISPASATAIVARNPATGELRHIAFAKILLTLGHNTPYLEARAEMETYMRDQTSDLHFIKPKLKLSFAFQSMAAPIINFPAITDTDGSLLIRDDYTGEFRYYLTYEESDKFLDEDFDKFFAVDSDEPNPNLIHKDVVFKKYFENTIKPRLQKRIPTMADAEFLVAYSGFDSYNSHDGLPVMGFHPFHSLMIISAGYGARTTHFGPAAAQALSELMLHEEEEFYDMTNFYWNRAMRGKRIDEFSSLLR